MNEALRIHSLVRIINPKDNSVAGMGFIVAKKYILTCMHVVLSSLGKNSDTDKRPDEDILVDFPGILPIHRKVKARVINGFLKKEEHTKRDVAVLEMKDAQEAIFSDAPMLSCPSNLDLHGIPCSYFFSRSPTVYGWGQGVITHSALLGRVQVNQMLAGSGRLVDCGFSGTPVWLDEANGVIGMIDEVVIGRGIATFIPNSVLIECLLGDIECKGLGNLNKVSVPKFPPDYVKRPRIIASLKNQITTDIKFNSANLIVLVGPSGSGKTQIALDIYYNHSDGKYWFDCQTIISKSDLTVSLINLNERDLIIIDNVVMNHPLFKDEWIREFKCNVIAITCEENVATDLLLQTYQKHVNEKIIKTSGFELDESTSFLNVGIPEQLIKHDEIERLHKVTHGIPLLMNFLKSIIIQERHLIEQENRFNLFKKAESLKKYLIRNQLSIEEVKCILIDKWLAQINDHSRSVLAILSFVPIIGMSSEAMLATSSIPQAELQEAISSLCNLGFIRLHFKSASRENLITIHDLLKELIVNHKKLNNASYVERYIDYLKEYHLLKKPAEVDLVSKADIFMLRMRLAFEKVRAGEINYDELLRQVSKVNDEISEYIPFDIGCSVTSEWIANIFEKAISTSDCAVLISLGQVVHNFKANAIMAEAIWQGAFNYDSWGRACCIHAAVSHWRRLDADKKQLGRRRLSDWIDSHLSEVSSYAQKGDKHRYFDTQIDLDVATALGGLCILGFEDDAIDILNLQNFNYCHRCTVASDLTVILFLVSHSSKTNARGNKAMQLINKYYGRIANSSALFLADEFLEMQGYGIDMPFKQNKVLTTRQFGATIAAAAYSQAFRQFTYDRGDKASFIGGIIPERL